MGNNPTCWGVYSTTVYCIAILQPQSFDLLKGFFHFATSHLTVPQKHLSVLQHADLCHNLWLRLHLSFQGNIYHRIMPAIIPNWFFLHCDPISQATVRNDQTHIVIGILHSLDTIRSQWTMLISGEEEWEKVTWKQSSHKRSINCITISQHQIFMIRYQKSHV